MGLRLVAINPRACRAFWRSATPDRFTRRLQVSARRSRSINTTGERLTAVFVWMSSLVAVPFPLTLSLSRKGNGAQLSHHPFAIFGKAEAMGRRPFVAWDLAARTRAGRGGQHQTLKCSQGGSG